MDIREKELMKVSVATAPVIDKEVLCQKIRLLRDDLAPIASDFLDLLLDYDEEPLSEGELLALKEAETDVAAGDFYTLEEFNRRMDALQ